MTRSADFNEALAFLIELIEEQGVEYPDAQYQTTLSFEVDADELQAAYDSYCNEGWADDYDGQPDEAQEWHDFDPDC